MAVRISARPIDGGHLGIRSMVVGCGSLSMIDHTGQDFMDGGVDARNPHVVF
jgi:hypothetical protein